MRKILLLLLFCSALVDAAGQQLSGRAYIDSLVSVLPQYAEDTPKVRLLNSISYSYDEYDPAEAIKYGEAALALAEKMGWKDGIAMAANTMGNANISRGNNALAMVYYKRALEIYNSTGNKKGSAQAMGNIATFYCAMSDYVNALAYWLDALTMFEAISDTPGIANQLGNIALVYQEQGNYPKSILFTQRALGMYRGLRDKDSEAMQLGNLANTYDKMGRTDDALAAYQAVMKIYAATGNKVGAARNMMNMGTTYCNKKEYEKAFECQFKALEIYAELNGSDDEGMAFTNLADAYFQIAVDTSPVIAGKYVFTDREKSLGMSIEYARKAIASHIKTSSIAALSFTYKVLANAQMETGQVKEARASYAMYEQFRDSVFTTESNLKIAALDWKRELELKDKQLELDRLAVAKKRNERYFYIGGFMLLFMVGGITIRNMKLAAAKELSENKLNAFQARMNPHFIFNALSSIQSLIMNNENERSIDYLSEFSGLMRQVLDNSMKSKVLLRTEINMLRSYIELEHLRFECFDWDIEIHSSVDPDIIEIPGMIVQPFVENAILHGLIPRGNGGRLTVTFERSGSHITCVVDDNGIGREASAVLNKSRNRARQSHGINIATNRLTLLNDKRKNIVNTVVYTDKQEQGIATGTKVTIQLPIL